MAYTVSGSISYINDEEYVVSSVANRPLIQLADNADIVSAAAASLIGGDYRTTITGVGWLYKRNIDHLDTHKSAIDKLDNAVGNRDYTDGKYLTDLQSVTTSLDILNNRIFALSGVDATYIEYLAQKAGLDKTTPISTSDPAYISNNNIDNGDPLETAIGKLDSALGLRTYTEKSYLTNGTVLTSSINLLELATTAVCTAGDGSSSFGKYNSIQSSLGYLGANGKLGTLAVKRGSHSVLPTLLVPSGVTVKGEGAATLYYTTSGTAAMFALSGYNSFEGVSIDRGDTWNYYSLSTTSNALKNCAAVVDKTGYLHVGAHNSTAGNLEYWRLKPVGDGTVFEAGSLVKKQSIGATTVTNTPVRMLLTPWGEPYLFWVDGSNVIQWARMGKASSIWAASTVPIASGVSPDSFDVALDSKGFIHCIYTATSTIKYSTNINANAADAGPFQAGTVEAAITGDELAVTVDPWNLVHFVYRHSTNNLRYRSGYMGSTGSLTGLSTVSTIDAGGAADAGVCVVADKKGLVHVAYKNSAGNGLNYSYKDTTDSVFTDATIYDSGAHFPKLVVDDNGIIHIGAFNPTNFNTIYLRSTDGGATFDATSTAYPGAYSVGTTANSQVALAVDNRDSAPTIVTRKGNPSNDSLNVSSRPPVFNFVAYRNRLVNLWIKGGRLGYTTNYTRVEGINGY